MVNNQYVGSFKSEWYLPFTLLQLVNIHPVILQQV